MVHFVQSLVLAWPHGDADEKDAFAFFVSQRKSDVPISRLES